MKILFALIFSASTLTTASAACFEPCLTMKFLGEKHQCLNRCYPEIVKFCDSRFPPQPNSPEARKMAVNECVRGAYPCQEKCQSPDKSKEVSCRNECLGVSKL